MQISLNWKKLLLTVCLGLTGVFMLRGITSPSGTSTFTQM